MNSFSGLSDIRSWFSNWMKSEVTKAAHFFVAWRAMKMQSGLFKELTEINESDTADSLLVRSKESSVCKTF